MALAGLLALAAGACSGTAAPHSASGAPEPARGALPATTPALSVAGPHYTRCADSVENDPRGPGALGSAMARQLRCERHTVVIAIPLPPTTTPEPPEVALFRTIVLLRSLYLSPSDHASLGALADYLRLSPKEPFIFGTRVDVSEDVSMSLRLEPKGGGARLMLMYRMDL